MLADDAHRSHCWDSSNRTGSSNRRIVVLLSGHGTNLQAILDACENGDLPRSGVVAVVSNREDAFGLVCLPFVCTHSLPSNNGPARQEQDNIVLRQRSYRYNII